MFGGVVGVLGIRLEGYLSGAKRAFDIESEYFDPVIGFPFDCFLSGVELLALVDVLPTSVTSPAYDVSEPKPLRSFHTNDLH